MKRIVLLFFIILVLFFCADLFAEQITLTTYYPSPYGVYKKLKVTEEMQGSTIAEAPTAMKGNFKFEERLKVKSLLLEGEQVSPGVKQVLSLNNTFDPNEFVGFYFTDWSFAGCTVPTMVLVAPVEGLCSHQGAFWFTFPGIQPQNTVTIAAQKMPPDNSLQGVLYSKHTAVTDGGNIYKIDRNGSIIAQLKKDCWESYGGPVPPK